MFAVGKKNKKIPYILKRYRLSKTVKLRVRNTGEIFVSAPFRMSVTYIDNFVDAHSDWIRTKIELLLTHSQGLPHTTSGDYPKYKEDARALVYELIQEVNAHYKFVFNRITIRNQRTRWGSCSRKGNLNFSYKLIFLPRHLARYVVAHELCHLQEFNHQKQFWDLVAQTVPEYKKIAQELRTYRI